MKHIHLFTTAFRRFLSISICVAAFSCTGAKAPNMPERSASRWDPSPAFPALSALFSAALGAPVRMDITASEKNPMERESNTMLFIRAAGKTAADEAVLGRAWVKPPETGMETVPVRIISWFAVAKPAKVHEIDRVMLRVPGGEPRDALRVHYVPLEGGRDALAGDRLYWRFYAFNPGDTRMALLLDGAWKRQTIPDPEWPEQGMVETIQDWRTDTSPDWLLGRWESDASLAPGSVEAMSFHSGGIYRYDSPAGVSGFGWYLKAGDDTFFLQAARLVSGGAMSAEVLGPRRSRIRYDHSRACITAAEGDTPLPSACLAPVR